MEIEVKAPGSKSTGAAKPASKKASPNPEIPKSEHQDNSSDNNPDKIDFEITNLDENGQSTLF